MLKKILIGLAAAVGLFLVVVAFQPAEFTVSRSATIAAPASVVFENVNVVQRWEGWNPFLEHDRDAKLAYNGPEAGVGASYSWAGNNKLGEGTSTITESRPDELIRFRLDFERPMKATNIAEFTFKPEGEKTVVTWSMSGRKNFVQKAFCLFMDMDKMVGGEFERGLGNLALLSEAPASPSAVQFG